MQTCLNATASTWAIVATLVVVPGVIQQQKCVLFGLGRNDCTKLHENKKRLFFSVYFGTQSQPQGTNVGQV